MLIAMWLGCAPAALAKDVPKAVIEVTPVAGSTYGDSLTIYGIVSAPTPGAPVPSGTITFATREPPFNINTPICSVTIDVDQTLQSCKYSGVIPVGTHHFILIYSGDSNYQGNDTGTLASEDYVISKQTPTFSLSSPPAPVFVGQYAALKFSFGNATNTEGKFTASVSGQAFCSIYSQFEICAAGKMLRAGTFGVSVMFDGDANHNAVPFTDVVGQVTVLEAPTSLQIEPHPAITLGATAEIVLTLSNIIDPGQAFFGDITLSDGEVSCRIQIVGETSGHCPFKPLSPGSRRLVATYSGLSGYSSPATATGTLEVGTTKVDGVCGADNGVVLAATPTNLCSAGVPSAVSGAGHPWTWTCAGSGGGADATCSATVRTWTVSAVTSGSGGAITPPSQIIDNGKTATLTVSADAGYAIAGATGCGGSLAGNKYTTGAVTADCTVTATFTAAAPTTYTVSAAATPVGTGSLVCASPVNAGATSTCTATPSAGYVTQSISGCGGTATGTGVNSYTTAAVNANCTVTATFTAAAPTTYTVTAVATPLGNGNLVCTSPVNAGATSTCTATPSAGYVTQSISGCGGTATGTGVNSYTTAAVNANCTVTATFAAAAPTTYTVTAVASPLGNGNLVCTSQVNAGATSTCTATPSAGYVTQSISGCGGTATGNGVNSYTTGPVNANCSVTAIFAAAAPPQASVPAPALDKWALALLGLLLAGMAAVISRRKG